MCRLPTPPKARGLWLISAPDTAEVIPEAPPSPAHVAIRREDYRPPDWLVPEIQLDFELDADRTRVRATLQVERNGDHDRPLRLDGDEMRRAVVKVDGAEPNGEWTARSW